MITIELQMDTTYILFAYGVRNENGSAVVDAAAILLMVLLLPIAIHN